MPDEACVQWKADWCHVMSNSLDRPGRLGTWSGDVNARGWSALKPVLAKFRSSRGGRSGTRHVYYKPCSILLLVLSWSSKVARRIADCKQKPARTRETSGCHVDNSLRHNITEKQGRAVHHNGQPIFSVATLAIGTVHNDSCGNVSTASYVYF
jgi:hypothetical protein